MIRSLLLTACLAAGAAAMAGATSFDSLTALRADNSEESDDRGSREAEVYDGGSKALDAGDWSKAQAAFEEVAQMGGARADGAVYWVAYAMAKQGRNDEALAVLRGFASKYPKSSWRKEARALELEIRPASGKTVLQEGGDDEDLKLMAINGLMSSEPERAVPLLEKVLKGRASPAVKERAIFVLAQSSSPRARQVLADVARGNSLPDLQEKAIVYLGALGGKDGGPLLAEIYASSSSPEVKEKILSAFMMSADKARVLEVARSEKSPNLRSTAVHLLGAMGARTELWQLYKSESTEPVQEAILNALFVAGDVEHVLALARTEPNVNLRREAIHRLGSMPAGETGSSLVSIYQGEKNTELKKIVLVGLFLQNNGKALVDIARSEKDPGLKAEAVSKLSMMHNKDATDYLLDILNH